MYLEVKKCRIRKLSISLSWPVHTKSLIQLHATTTTFLHIFINSDAYNYLMSGYCNVIYLHLPSMISFISYGNLSSNTGYVKQNF